MTPSKHAIIVSRRWTAPAISVDVTEEGIGIVMSLDDFLAALLAEVGSPTLTFSRAKLAEQVNAAASRVVSEMKAATAQVM